MSSSLVVIVEEPRAEVEIALSTRSIDPILNLLEAQEISAMLEDCANQCSVLAIGSYQHNPDVSAHSVRVSLMIALLSSYVLTLVHKILDDRRWDFPHHCCTDGSWKGIRQGLALYALTDNRWECLRFSMFVNVFIILIAASRERRDQDVERGPIQAGCKWRCYSSCGATA